MYLNCCRLQLLTFRDFRTRELSVSLYFQPIHSYQVRSQCVLDYRLYRRSSFDMNSYSSLYSIRLFRFLNERFLNHKNYRLSVLRPQAAGSAFRCLLITRSMVSERGYWVPFVTLPPTKKWKNWKPFQQVDKSKWASTKQTYLGQILPILNTGCHSAR